MKSELEARISRICCDLPSFCFVRIRHQVLQKLQVATSAVLLCFSFSFFFLAKYEDGNVVLPANLPGEC